MTENKFATGEDGNTIFEITRRGSVEILTPVDTWSELAKAVKQMEKLASDPCFLCTDFDKCNSCPDNPRGRKL